jgi:hypothetical protein
MSARKRLRNNCVLRTKLISDIETWPKNVVISYSCNVYLSVSMMSIVSSFYSKKQLSTQHKQTYITHKVVASVLVLCCGSIFLYAPAITIHIPSGITQLKKWCCCPSSLCFCGFFFLRMLFS